MTQIRKHVTCALHNMITFFGCEYAEPSYIGFIYDIHTNASTNAEYGHEYVSVAYVILCLEYGET